MESAGRNKAGLSLEKILKSFLANHFVESVNIKLGMLDDLAGCTSIQVRASSKSSHVKRFFDYVNLQLVLYDLGQIEIGLGYTEVLPNSDDEILTYIISPKIYSQEKYVKLTRDLLKKLPRFLRDFNQKRL